MVKNPNGPSGIYNYENYGRPLTPYELRTVGEVTVLYEHRRLKKIAGVNLALQELLTRHDSLLQLIARKSHERYNLTSDYDDKLQHARYGAMYSYEKFDIDKARENRFKLYNYVGNCVSMHLNNANDNDDYINCPPIRRMARSYLSGRYDEDLNKKAIVEQRLGVNNQSDKSDLQIKYGSLVAEFTSSDIPATNKHDSTNWDCLVDTFEDEDINLHEKLHLIQLIERLTERQQKVAKKMFIDEHTIAETCSLLNLTNAQVRRDVQVIRNKLKSVHEHEPVYF